MTVEQRLAEIEERLHYRRIDPDDTLWLLTLVRTMQAVVEAAAEVDQYADEPLQRWERNLRAALQDYRRESEK